LAASGKIIADMIEVAGLCKTFRDPAGQPIKAVDGVSFSARAGEILGLLGPNGAGKTTTLRVLCTLLKPTAGTARVAGFDVVGQADEVRRHVGFLSATTGVYDRMTAREMVEYYGRLNGLAGEQLEGRIAELFQTLGMHDIRNVRGSKMSTGQKQKVSIARALIHDPPVLILDEPTNGLDVLVQRSLLQQVKALRERGKCVIYSTHIFREVEKICDRVAIIHRGKVLDAGTLNELRDRHKEQDLEELFFGLIDASGEA
jgi:sodium transport system ATP-binding protein